MPAQVTFEITTADQLIFDLNIVDKHGLPVQKYGTVGCLFPGSSTFVDGIPPLAIAGTKIVWSSSYIDAADIGGADILILNGTDRLVYGIDYNVELRAIAGGPLLPFAQFINTEVLISSFIAIPGNNHAQTLQSVFTGVGQVQSAFNGYNIATGLYDFEVPANHGIINGTSFNISGAHHFVVEGTSDTSVSARKLSTATHPSGQTVINSTGLGYVLTQDNKITKSSFNNRFKQFSFSFANTDGRGVLVNAFSSNNGSTNITAGVHTNCVLCDASPQTVYVYASVKGVWIISPVGGCYIGLVDSTSKINRNIGPIVVPLAYTTAANGAIQLINFGNATLSTALFKSATDENGVDLPYGASVQFLLIPDSTVFGFTTSTATGIGTTVNLFDFNIAINSTRIGKLPGLKIISHSNAYIPNRTSAGHGMELLYIGNKSFIIQTELNGWTD